MRPIGIDLFAGAGGMSLGFEQAGFDVVAAVEIDPVHCLTHKFNFPRCAVIPHSVEKLKGSEIRLAAGIGNRPIDVVFGGAPCQGFSLIGQRILDDPRNKLVKDFLRIVAELDANSFVFENVKGLTLGTHRKLLDEFVLMADTLGYTVRTPWKILNAGHFGTPQNRERLILFGAKKSSNLAYYPAPMTARSGKKEPNDISVIGPTVQDALHDLPDAENYEALWHSDSVLLPDSAWGALSAYAREMRCLDDNAWHNGYRREWDSRVLTSSMRTKHTDISRRRFAATREGDTEPVSRFFKLPKSGVSNTLRAGTDGARGAFTSPRPIHYRYDRCITVREMARLHGFPDWFRFHETKWHGARQIGNSVPPPLARAIGLAVIKALGKTPERPSEIIALNNTEWLRWTVSKAADFFDVPCPPTKRDRSSGIKKRKQEEVEAARVDNQLPSLKGKKAYG